MTETLHAPPPSDPPPAGPPPGWQPGSPADPRRLVRDPDDKVVAGVCAAFARYTDTDPVLWRVTVAVLALFGGAGLGLYALGWLLLPRAGQSQSAVERLLRRPDVSIAGVVVLVLGGVVLLALLDDGAGVGALLVVGGIAYLVSRERREAGLDGPGAAPAVPSDPGQPGRPPEWAAPPRSPRPPREPSPLLAITLSGAALVTGLLLALRAGGVDGLTAPRVIAAALLVVGTGLLVGAWYGRARWLLAVGLVLALALAAAEAAQRVGLEDGLGERTWRAVDGQDYALGIGEGVLDLRGLRGVSGAEVSARIGAGHLVVLVPEDLSVRVTSDVDAGQVVRVELDGSRTEWTPQEGTDVQQDFVVGTSDDVSAVIDLEVGVGEIEVRRVAA